MVIFTIDGNIGAGKTSVLNYLHKHYKLSIDLEPVEKWQPYLKDFYEDKKNTFNLQVRVWLDRCWIQEKSERSMIIMERSPFFIRNVFLNTVKSQDLITSNEFNILNDLYDKTDGIWSCSAYIYLRSNPEKCMERIKKRARDCEETITLDYINLLHDSHEDAYNEVIHNNFKVYCINVEDKTIAQIAKEIYDLPIIQNEMN